MKTDYDKFDPPAFDQSVHGREAVQNMVNELHDQILTDVGRCVAHKVAEIVELLNLQGHKLKINRELTSSAETDYCESHGSDSCGFRIGTYAVVSVGSDGLTYSDTVDDS